MAARLTRGARTPAVATALQIGCVASSALDGLAVENLIDICGRRTVDLLDAGDELDLRSALETARHAQAIPHARISGDSGRLSWFVTAVLTLAMVREHPRVSLYALASILAGVPFYYIWQG